MPATGGMDHRRNGMVKERKKGIRVARLLHTGIAEVVEIQKKLWFGGIGDNGIRRCRKEGRERSSQSQRVRYQNPNPPALAKRTRRLATLSLLAR